MKTLIDRKPAFLALATGKKDETQGWWRAFGPVLKIFKIFCFFINWYWIRRKIQRKTNLSERKYKEGWTKNWYDIDQKLKVCM